MLAAIETAVVKAPEVMEWLQGIARKSGELERPVYWVTPAGFLVWYTKFQEKPIRIPAEAGLLRKALTFNLPVSGPDGLAVPNVQKTTIGLTAVYVHSMDASHLMLTMAQAKRWGIESVAVQHDSFGTVAADAPKLWGILREQFVAMYERDVLADLRRQLNSACPELDIPAPPARGTLDLRGVLDSKYFFS